MPDEARKWQQKWSLEIGDAEDGVGLDFQDPLADCIAEAAEHISRLLDENEILGRREVGLEKALIRNYKKQDELQAANERLTEYARHKSDCPVSRAWGSGPGGTGIKCECGFDPDYKHRPRGFGGWQGRKDA